MVLWNKLDCEKETTMSTWRMRWYYGVLVADSGFTSRALTLLFLSFVVGLRTITQSSQPRFQLACLNKAVYPNIHVVHILGGRYRHMIYGVWIIKFIGVPICTLQLRRRKTCWQTCIFAGWHNIDLFAVPLQLQEMVFMNVNWWRDWEPSCLLVVPTLQVFTNYLNIDMLSSTSDCYHIWRIANTELLFFLRISSGSIARDNVVLSKTAHSGTISTRYRMLTSFKGYLISLLKEFCFYEIVLDTIFDPLLAY